MVSDSKVTVLIQGESGTGKELIARAIHYQGSFQKLPFMVVDCSTLVDTLTESQLFGYEKGAFTGADITRKGTLELAGEGTIFSMKSENYRCDFKANCCGFYTRRNMRGWEAVSSCIPMPASWPPQTWI